MVTKILLCCFIEVYRFFLCIEQHSSLFFHVNDLSFCMQCRERNFKSYVKTKSIDIVFMLLFIYIFLNLSEREYQCLGQWEEDGLLYTYTHR